MNLLDKDHLRLQVTRVQFGLLLIFFSCFFFLALAALGFAAFYAIYLISSSPIATAILTTLGFAWLLGFCFYRH